MLVLGGGKLSFRAVIVYFVERVQALIKRVAQAAEKLRQLAKAAREKAAELAEAAKKKAEELARRAKEALKRKAGTTLKRDFAEVEIVDATGKPIGEFDGIDMKSGTFIEDKSATGIETLNPRTGKPFQTAEQWAAKQIYTKSVNRIENLKKAAETRATKSGSSVVPALEKIKDFRNLHFVIDSKNFNIARAVADELANLKKQYPDWHFTADFGK